MKLAITRACSGRSIEIERDFTSVKRPGSESKNTRVLVQEGEPDDSIALRPESQPNHLQLVRRQPNPGPYDVFTLDTYALVRALEHGRQEGHKRYDANNQFSLFQGEEPPAINSPGPQPHPRHSSTRSGSVSRGCPRICVNSWRTVQPRGPHPGSEASGQI